MSQDSRKKNIARIIAWQPPEPAHLERVCSQLNWLKARELSALTNNLEFLEGKSEIKITVPFSSLALMREAVGRIAAEALKAERPDNVERILEFLPSTVSAVERSSIIQRLDQSDDQEIADMCNALESLLPSERPSTRDRRWQAACEKARTIGPELQTLLSQWAEIEKTSSQMLQQMHAA